MAALIVPATTPHVAFKRDLFPVRFRHDEAGTIHACNSVENGPEDSEIRRAIVTPSSIRAVELSPAKQSRAGE
jgi:hypothetical protein